MEKLNFEKLQIYQLAEQLADEIWFIVKNWDEFERNTIGRQIVRSADSIGANIAEGNGRHNFRDNKRFIKIARGSLNETRHWLRRAYVRKLLTSDRVNQLKPIVNDLSIKLNAYLKYLEKASQST
ncbi:MAG: four helix bundle protein [Hydrococcus sp. C42_A2020_068]|uniref:four helix bundle protein n=1 Tax=Pleurocapsa sp. PCC 7327 TaxID=118163 RepID=UPI00029FCB8A|nr:four helix bundle protein [Pleurocapsa sp. PCC 7327]AFY76379.1 S23 ribosomal protein [Pleurocapsa sp. PCC 7327]MBF2018817.1 four helix bundle protein [Hydrococcus sp. C42_A2020_068]